MLRRLLRAPDALSRGQFSLGLVAAFAVSRAAWFALGVRFNDYPLRVYWQFLAPRLLRARLLESVYHLHSQPPLFNLYLGTVLKLAGENASLAFHALSALAGLGVLLLSVALMRRLGVGRAVSAALSLWLVTSPAFVAYENWLFYSLPLAFLLALSALLLQRFLAGGSAGPFFAVLFLIAASRSLFHLAWLLAVAAGLVWLRPARRGAVLRGAALPLLLLVSLYAKNLVVFGSFSLSSWAGMNLARLTVEELPEPDRERLIAEGCLSETSRLPAFSRPWQYPSSDFAPDPRFARVPAVSRLDKWSETANYNHLGYLGLSRRYLQDALCVVRREPGVYLGAVAKAWGIYFRSPSSLKFLGVENRRRLATAFDVYDYVFFGRVPWVGLSRGDLGEADFTGARYLALLIGLPLVFAYGLAAALGRAAPWLGSDQRLLVGYLCFDIAWVAVVGNLLELGENNRFRFETDPLSLVLLGLCLERAVRRASGQGGAPQPIPGHGAQPLGEALTARPR
jgi:hypothetical protein